MNKINLKTAFITGISGQDGAYLSKLLLEKGYKIIGITRNNHSDSFEKLKSLKIDERIVMEECDLLDISSVIALIDKYLPDEIYNLAAQSSVGQSFKQPIGTINFNIISVLNLLEAIRLMKPDVRFYQASSSEMYGKVSNLPVSINTPMHPLSPYAISKASAHWTVVNYRESYGLYACNGVLFNHESYLRSSGFFVKKVLHESVRNKYNPNWILKVGNIDIKRDFGYSPNYVEAMWLMLQCENADDFIICSGTSITLRSIIEYIFGRLNISLDRLLIDTDLMRPTEIEDIYGDNTPAKTKLGWKYELDFYAVLDILIAEELKEFELK
ncbi:GDP-mannose 4,6-dehydratase [Flavobacterium gawalongense]|uniref:GDP-mannose 4,6-dehydratase n=1 Tax=Flavobacterium gawalongense TaxID=2594432 RepID=A0A553BYJ3_9FLAO|nr:GDP-mannose 4,6-dehydratase [Flavobacterium gawalongense]TRX13392.1 GDP-mannose 4,6-dehydratase [Flavobacterium gawalongense]TRX15678.1 GDP-mannose 4,6-dehydratase [Flavobacterium gawalongense]TRX31516.1 GDP-mannose 4,6-dehydratase [Flavobacterium gawalongense]